MTLQRKGARKTQKRVRIPATKLPHLRKKLNRTIKKRGRAAKRVAVVSVALVTLLAPFLGASGAAEREAASAPKKLVKAKLDHSQKILEGLTTGDLRLVAREAKALHKLSQDDYWKALTGTQYAANLANFQLISDELSRRAEEGNVDGATLAYVQLTLNCVNCHKHLRRALRKP